MSHDKLKPINKILLVAGGVGINPLSSMIHYVMKTEGSLRQSTKLNLVYSAKTKDELIFKVCIHITDEMTNANSLSRIFKRVKSFKVLLFLGSF